ncbi:hypothetical protein EAG_08774 [Camponotus floridanus]|uniref:Uncharacterized protein n=1 Tax=Camponotus floridanus TaxID=104421 RepID=E2APF8_CAMFO|nr:hypothetical protein EAG_08774 [Camponotus floridanus]
MNFYVPIRNGETQLCKKQKCDTIQPRCAARILGIRYAPTPTLYKYLDIGISVGAVSYIELILGDNRGNQIVLPFSTWNLLMRKQADPRHAAHILGKKYALTSYKYLDIGISVGVVSYVELILDAYRGNHSVAFFNVEFVDAEASRR